MSWPQLPRSGSSSGAQSLSFCRCLFFGVIGIFASLGEMGGILVRLARPQVWEAMERHRNAGLSLIAPPQAASVLNS